MNATTIVRSARTTLALVEKYAPERGSFRAFLKAALANFLRDEAKAARRQKRGGGILHLSLNWQDADERFHLDPPDPSGPDKTFDREWALPWNTYLIASIRSGKYDTMTGWQLKDDRSGYDEVEVLSAES